MKKVILLIIPMFILSFGCTKSVNGIRNQTLENHVWQLTDQTENGVDIPLRECDMEARYYFYGTGNGKKMAGSVTCDSMLIVTGTDQAKDTTVAVNEVDFLWSVTGNQQYIYLKHFGNADYNPDWQIISMDEHTFRIKGYNQNNGQVTTYYKTFVSVQNL